MSPAAIVLMIVSIGLLWGGLVVNILHLRYRKVPDDVVFAAQEQHAEKKAQRLAGKNQQKTQK